MFSKKNVFNFYSSRFGVHLIIFRLEGNPPTIKLSISVTNIFIRNILCLSSRQLTYIGSYSNFTIMSSALMGCILSCYFSLREEKEIAVLI